MVLSVSKINLIKCYNCGTIYITKCIEIGLQEAKQLFIRHITISLCHHWVHYSKQAANQFYPLFALLILFGESKKVHRAMLEKPTAKPSWEEKEIIWVLQCTPGTHQTQTKNILHFIAVKINDPLNVLEDTKKMSYYLI